jgi:hypothetical protein
VRLRPVAWVLRRVGWQPLPLPRPAQPTSRRRRTVLPQLRAALRDRTVLQRPRKALRRRAVRWAGTGALTVRNQGLQSA